MEKKFVLEYLKARFGITEKYFEAFEFYSASKGRIFLGPKNLTVVDERNVSVGVLVARLGDNDNVKPTTNMLQMFGKFANRNIVKLTKENAVKYAEGSDIEVSDQEVSASADGYVIIAYNGDSLGCGLLKGGKIKNMLPKAKRMKIEFL